MSKFIGQYFFRERHSLLGGDIYKIGNKYHASAEFVVDDDGEVFPRYSCWVAETAQQLAEKLEQQYGESFEGIEWFSEE